ncbi:DUF1415 domain-containing protein [Motilimonas cestriensis]|uniref:DUF1415 domain-containing protein n=1 Tax=Motilimonas cestriensis TaxID=2742685 RepID=A0ABS8W8G1_9GAMM|nr:DUF1415 domain-containing protein [Motilimonas cestriensis]MCE2595284.1 DUF1415 domain-containing protein [Motilimonas cestriensis]
MIIKQAEFEQAIWTWLEQVVIGLNLCPFANKPHRNKQIQVLLSDAKSPEQFLDDLAHAFGLLDSTDAKVLDTVLFATPNLFADFMDFNDALDWADALLAEQDWYGVYQIASFHPDYQFAGTAPDDDENLTNRAPYPIFHLIREESMNRALDSYPEHDQIPERNIARVSALTDTEKKHLFSYLYKD